MSRVEKGFNLFQKGNVSLIFADEEMLQFEVKSKKKVYLVASIDGILKCDCEDYQFRFQRESNAKNGSFLCSHCFAALFELGRVRGIGSQSTLEFADRKVIV
jgi:hypothetical protein